VRDHAADFANEWKRFIFLKLTDLHLVVNPESRQMTNPG
jgi:hypothetical protein